MEIKVVSRTGQKAERPVVLYNARGTTVRSSLHVLDLRRFVLFELTVMQQVALRQGQINRQLHERVEQTATNIRYGLARIPPQLGLLNAFLETDSSVSIRTIFFSWT